MPRSKATSSATPLSKWTPENGTRSVTLSLGYTTIQMDAGKWYQVGNPFVDLQGNVVVSLNDVFNTGFSEGDTLCVLDSETSAYSAYLYWIDGKGWCNRPIAAIAVPTDKTLKAGEAVYIQKKVVGTVQLSGKVEAKVVEFGSETKPGLVQVAPMWPEARTVNDFKWTGLQQGDTLTVLNSDKGSYDAYVYWNEAKNAWCDRPIPAIAQPATVQLTPGQAVYIEKKAQGKATVSAQ